MFDASTQSFSVNVGPALIYTVKKVVTGFYMYIKTVNFISHAHLYLVYVAYIIVVIRGIIRPAETTCT